MRLVLGEGTAGTTYRLAWLDLEDSAWRAERRVEGGAPVRPETPGEGHWIAPLTDEASSP